MLQTCKRDTLEAMNRPSYASLTESKVPNRLLVETLSLLPEFSGKALDVGAGALSDSLFLAKAGFEVDAIDPDDVSARIAAEILHPRLHFFHTRIENFEVLHNTYHIINASRVLPFLSRDLFDTIVPRLVEGLTDDGILCATIFGDRDGWAEKDSMTCISRSEAEALLPHIVTLREREFDGPTVSGTQKHWHVFEMIAKKPGHH